MTITKFKSIFNKIGTIASLLVLTGTFVLLWRSFSASGYGTYSGQIAFYLLTFPLAFFILGGAAFIILLLLIWKKSALFLKIVWAVICISFLGIALLSGIQNKHYADRIGTETALLGNYTFSFSGTDTYSDLEEDVVYKTAEDEDLLLDVWDTKVNDENRPVIVNIHGGGWSGGDKSEVSSWSKWFNSKGYVVFNVEYNQNGPGMWQKQISDTHAALNWIVEHADEYHLDINRINLLGSSAGGHLALLTGYTELKENSLVPKETDSGSTVKINSIINLYGPSDLLQLYSKNHSKEFVHPLLEQLLDGQPKTEEIKHRYQQMSPIQYVNKTSAPTISFVGQKDKVVPEEQIEILHEKLDENNIDNQAYYFPFSDHSYDTNWKSIATQTTREKIEEFLNKYN
ncbi:alpha/beta hydrolase [Oceanobacillus sojae]|uniref:alpha/beta hydrolase n=1 Tax=Oceanobacillus sojae TaxID=582851 RepID=UPI0021A7CADA|nr:alpha/beta hydrolase [Oceanobacillus sojae]MCT1901098.1 alpha/beta hydrolase [Oceanobacillus sojae]